MHTPGKEIKYPLSSGTETEGRSSTIPWIATLLRIGESFAIAKPLGSGIARGLDGPLRSPFFPASTLRVSPPSASVSLPFGISTSYPFPRHYPPVWRLVSRPLRYTAAILRHSMPLYLASCVVAIGVGSRLLLLPLVCIRLLLGDCTDGIRCTRSHALQRSFRGAPLLAFGDWFGGALRVAHPPNKCLCFPRGSIRQSGYSKPLRIYA